MERSAKIVLSGQQTREHTARIHILRLQLRIAFGHIVGNDARPLQYFTAKIAGRGKKERTIGGDIDYARIKMRPSGQILRQHKHAIFDGNHGVVLIMAAFRADIAETERSLAPFDKMRGDT